MAISFSIMFVLASEDVHKWNFQTLWEKHQAGPLILQMMVLSCFWIMYQQNQEYSIDSHLLYESVMYICFLPLVHLHCRIYVSCCLFFNKCIHLKPTFTVYTCTSTISHREAVHTPHLHVFVQVTYNMLPPFSVCVYQRSLIAISNI